MGTEIWVSSIGHIITERCLPAKLGVFTMP
jgi:hypothetical protein